MSPSGLTFQYEARKYRIDTKAGDQKLECMILKWRNQGYSPSNDCWSGKVANAESAYNTKCPKSLAFHRFCCFERVIGMFGFFNSTQPQRIQLETHPCRSTLLPCLLFHMIIQLHIRRLSLFRIETSSRWCSVSTGRR